MSDAHADAVAPTMPLGMLGLPPGTVLVDRYEIQALLGEGGMGAVYRVMDRELGEQVALKVLRPELASADGALERFRREVKLARRVTHPNVARTYDLGIAAGMRFLTMELVQGQPLSRSVGNGRRTAMSAALRIAGEIARGLSAAHAVGVVHRDLKPDNVMMSSDRVVITDFGIARIAEGAAGIEHATRTLGAAIGTPAYMSPEQAEGREVDGRADLYALGVLLYELLIGQLPFQGETVYALVAARLNQDPPDPRLRDPSIPGPLAELLLSLLARRRDRRPDAPATLARIEALRGGARQGEVLPVVVPPAVAPITAAPTPTSPRTLAMAPLATADAADRALASEVADACAGALSTLRWLRVLPSATVAPGDGTDGRVDPRALGRTHDAELVVTGSLRSARGVVRLRLQILEVSTGAQIWGAAFDGAADDPFALEDRVSRELLEALRARGVGAQRRGPDHPEVRALWEKGCRAYQLLNTRNLEEASDCFEQALRISPNDPYVMSALGATLLRKWRTVGGRDIELTRRAEDLSIRALAADPTIGDTYNSIGILRLHQGELRPAIRAFEEAANRSPSLLEPRVWLARLLCETGHVEEGIRRLEQLAVAAPDAIPPQYELLKVYNVLGDEAARRLHHARLDALGADARRSFVFHEMRGSIWSRDHARIRQCIEVIEENEPERSALRRYFLPTLRSLLDGTPAREAAAGLIAMTAESSGMALLDASAGEYLCDYFLAREEVAEAVVRLEAVGQNRAFYDLIWLDRSPLLEPLRDDPRFQRVRALTVARVSDMWGR